MTDERDDRSDPVVVAVAVCLVSVAAVVPIVASARPANQIPVSDLPGEDDSLERPNGNAWREATPATVPLASAPSQVPNANDTTIEEVAVRAAHTDDRLYVRLSWADGSADLDLDPFEERTPHGGSFQDAAAVQLPANASADPGIAMGSTREPVNVWYWRADEGQQELLAEGPETTAPFADSALGAASSYDDDDGRWTVVFARELVVDDDAAENRTAIEMDEDVNVALGVWNGSNTERAGRKAVSEWHYFPLGPGAEGPPYATILWTVAGLAIVVVLVATALGVARSGEGGGEP